VAEDVLRTGVREALVRKGKRKSTGAA
jgi:hypothetical protein